MQQTNFHENLQALGASATTNADIYADSMSSDDPFRVLECFPAPSADSSFNPAGVQMKLNITTEEFTSLCPMTGQPDFARILIEYIPDQLCVESKSMKLYFLGFRNRRDFHETCVVKITNDLVALLSPKYLKVKGEFTPRGGIPFWPTCEYTKPDA